MAEIHLLPAALVGAATAPVVAGPLQTVFDELGLTLAIMGTIGGAVHALALQLPWKRVSRPMILGGLLGFGLGVAAPLILQGMFGWEGGFGGSTQALAAAAFLIGLLQERVLEYLRKE